MIAIYNHFSSWLLFALFFVLVSPIYAVGTGTGPAATTLWATSCDSTCLVWNGRRRSAGRFEIQCGTIQQVEGGEIGLSITGTPCNDKLRIVCSGSSETRCVDGWLEVALDRVCSEATKIYSYGLDGDDKIDASGATCSGIVFQNHNGNNGNDKIKGSSIEVPPSYVLDSFGEAETNFDEVITGGPGNDDLIGAGGNDHIKGGGGNDKIDGGLDGDILEGNAGNDDIFADPEPYVDSTPTPYFEDSSDGGSGNDCLNSGGGEDYSYGGTGNDHISGSFIIYGEGGDDRLSLSVCRMSEGFYDGWLFGGLGNDRLLGSECDESLSGDDGNDFLFGVASSCSVSDYVNGGIGDDTYISFRSRDISIGDRSDSYYGIIYGCPSPFFGRECPSTEDFCDIAFYRPRDCVRPVFPL